MERVQWDSELDTGEPSVDAQHRHFIEIFNELLEVGNADTMRIIGVLDDLTDHVNSNFAAEEELMSRLAYPDPELAEHLKEHRKLKREADNLSIDFRRGWLKDRDALVDYLLIWLRDHINEHDRALAQFARSQP